MLRDCIKEEASELELLDLWYKRDDNYVPAVYVLQPISSILTNFNNKVNCFNFPLMNIPLVKRLRMFSQTRTRTQRHACTHTHIDR